MPKAEVTNLALARIAKDLERLRIEADKAKLPRLVYIIEVGILEAREQVRAAAKRASEIKEPGVDA